MDKPNTKTKEGISQLAQMVIENPSVFNEIASLSHSLNSKLSRKLLNIHKKAVDSIQVDTSKRRIPLPVAREIAYAIMDQSLDEQDLVRASLAKYNSNVPEDERYTEDMFKLVRHSNMGLTSVISHVESHPLAAKIKEAGLWRVNKQMKRWGQLMKELKKSVENYNQLVSLQGRLSEVSFKALEEAKVSIQLAFEYGRIDESERKLRLVHKCKEYGLTLVETSAYTGIPLPTVKRKSASPPPDKLIST